MGLLLFRISLIFYFVSNPIIAHVEDKKEISILLFGDSLLAGYSLPQDAVLDVKLNQLFEKNGHNIKVYNASTPGDTSAVGANKAEYVAEKFKDVDIVFIAFGGNDILRRMSPSYAKENFEFIIEQFQKRGIKVILCDVKVPINFGLQYGQDYQAIFDDLEDKYDLTMHPFILELVYYDNSLMLSDRTHPNVKGVEHIASEVYKFLLDYIDNNF